MPAGHHLDRLREAMDHVPSEWRYNGDVRDTGFPGDGRCACGHKIRYEFVIERPRDGAKLVIGSHCIRTSVPYLMEEGAKHLAEALERASAEHEREREREKRDGRARDALGQATDDIRRLADWFEREQARCRAAAAERGQVVEALADDLHQPPRAPEPAETPGRTLARARRRFTTAWLRAMRYAHEHEAEPPEPPEPPRVPGLREHVDRAVAAGEADARSEFHAACRFARLVEQDDQEARAKVPVPPASRARRAYVVPGDSGRLS